MASIFETISRRFQSGIQEVREGLPLARKGTTAIVEDVKKRGQTPSPFLKQSSPPQIRRVGAENIFAQISKGFQALAPTPEEARKQGLVQVPKITGITKEEALGTLRGQPLPQDKTVGFLDPLSAIGGIKRVGAKAIGQVGKQVAKQIVPKTKPITPVVKGVERVVQPVQRERGFITSVKEAVPPLRIGGQYISRSTDELAIKAKNLIKDNITTAERMALEGTDDNAVAVASELIKHYGDEARRATGATQQALYDKAADVANTIAPKLTEQGRAIQAASILSNQTPEGILRFAARTIQKYNEEVVAARGGLGGLRKKVPELTGEQAKDFLERSRKIQAMPDGTDKAMAFKKLQDDIADLIPSPWYKKIINLWKAGLLTGLKTSGLNSFSNLFHGVSEIVKDIPAVGVDSVASLFTGKRSLAFALKGKGGLKEGFQKGLRYMKTGFDERNVAVKLDWRRVTFGKSKFAKGVQRYEETVFRWMGAQDQPFYYGAKARSIGSQAIAQGKNSGKKGAELKKFIDNLIENPTDDMLRYATGDAEIAVFQNRTVLGDLARGFQKLGGGAGEVIVPFGRTPSAVAMQIINFSPIGIVKTIVQNIGKGRFDQRLFAQGIGRGLTGTGAMFIGMELFKKELVSLDFPVTERERNQWQLEGRKPNSFKTPDGKWRSVLVLGPLGMTVLLGAHLQRAVNENGSLANSLPEASFAALKSFKEQTFLVGVNQFSNAMNDPDRYAQSVVSRTVGSVVPTIVSDIGRTLDPLERRTFARAEGFFSPLQSRVPIVRQSLEPKIDVFGSPLTRTGNALETMIDPSRPTRIKSNELIVELRRLLDAGFSTTPTRFADEKTYTNVLTPEQITSLQEKAGLILEDKLTNLIGNSQYKKLDNEEKMKKIKDFTNKSRVIARAAMVEELTRELQGEELKTKFSELKNAGFMTRGVFNKWDELFN